MAARKRPKPTHVISAADRSWATLHVVDGDGDSWRVDYKLAPINGRLEPVEMLLRCRDVEESERQLDVVTKPKPITTTLIRSLNLGSRFEAERASWGEAFDKLAAKDERWKVERDRMTAPPAAKGGPTSLPIEELQKTADAWLEARKNGAPLNRAVRDACHVSESGANKRIARARAAGLIPPATRRTS